jgi:hypothetical protein
MSYITDIETEGTMATEKQLSYISFLASKKGMTVHEARTSYFGDSGWSQPLTRREASELIDWLKA